MFVGQGQHPRFDGGGVGEFAGLAGQGVGVALFDLLCEIGDGEGLRGYETAGRRGWDERFVGWFRDAADVGQQILV